MFGEEFFPMSLLAEMLVNPTEAFLIDTVFKQFDRIYTAQAGRVWQIAGSDSECDQRSTCA
jgi:hypothetical protein